MTVNTIRDDLVKYVCMVIGYKIFYASRMNFIPLVMVHATYRMIKENAKCDLCTYMKNQLLENLKLIKSDESQRFKFGQLLIGLFFYFQIYFPGVDDVEWSTDLPVTKQIKESLQVVRIAYLETEQVFW